MNRLKREFEEQLRAELAADGDVRIGGVKLTPLAILDPNSETYDAEYLRWRDEEWLPGRFERQKAILGLVTDNRARFQNLADALQRQRADVFVGAGMSIASKLKSWPNFLRDLRADGTCPPADLEALLSGPTTDYEAAADLVYRHMDARLFRDRMRTRFQVPFEQIAGPVRLLPFLFQRRVFTTNYDNILEDVYADEGQSFGLIVHGNQQLEDIRRHLDETRPALLKLHGDELYRSQRVFLTSEYEQVYAPGSYLRQELSKAAAERNLLFLGCSLSADRTMQVLHEAAQADQSQPDHYAFMAMPNDSDVWRKRENALAAHGIYPIWYDAPTPEDHDDAIEALLVGLLREMKKL